MSYNYFKKYRKFNKMGFGQASNITKKKKGGGGVRKIMALFYRNISKYWIIKEHLNLSNKFY